MSLLIIIANLFWWYSARKDAREESAWSFPYRMFVWPEVFEQQKSKLSEKAHDEGAFSIGSLLVLTAVLFTAIMYPSAWWKLAVYFILCFISCGLTYWRYFDIVYSIGIGQQRFFLGGTAKLDRWLTNKYGINAGRKKALFCLIGIVVCDAVVIGLGLVL